MSRAGVLRRMVKYGNATPAGIDPAYKWDRFVEPGAGGRPYIEVASPTDEVVVARLTWNGHDAPMDVATYGHAVSSKLIEWLFRIAPAAIG